MENIKIIETLSDGTQKELCISDVIGSLLIKAQKIYGNKADKFSIEIKDNMVCVIGQETVKDKPDLEFIVWKMDKTINFLF